MNDFEPFKFSIAEVKSATSSVPEKDWRLLPGETEKERGERLLQGMIEIGQRGSGQVGEAK